VCSGVGAAGGAFGSGVGDRATAPRSRRAAKRP